MYPHINHLDSNCFAKKSYMKYEDMNFLRIQQNFNFDNDKIPKILQIILHKFYSKNYTIDPVGSHVEIWLVFFHICIARQIDYVISVMSRRV